MADDGVKVIDQASFDALSELAYSDVDAIKQARKPEAAPGGDRPKPPPKEPPSLKEALHKPQESPPVEGDPANDAEPENDAGLAQDRENQPAETADASRPKDARTKAAQLASNVFDFLYIDLAPYVTAFYSDRVNFGSLEKELNELLRRLSFAGILEQADDRIYIEALKRSLRRSRDRAQEVSVVIANLASAMSAQRNVRDLFIWAARENVGAALLTDSSNTAAASKAPAEGKALLEDIRKLDPKHLKALSGVASSWAAAFGAAPSTKKSSWQPDSQALSDPLVIEAVEVLTERKRARLSAVLDCLQRPLSENGPAPLSSSERTAIQQLQIFMVGWRQVLEKIDRVLAVLSSPNIESVLEAELEPMRLHGVEIQTAPVAANFVPLFIATVIGLFAAGAAYAMSIVPWWKPFVWWMLAAPVGAFVLAKGVRRYLDNSIVRDIRRGFACTMFDAKKKGSNEQRKVFDFLRGRAFLASPRPYWEHRAADQQHLLRTDPTLIEGEFLRYLSRDPYNRFDRWLRGFVSKRSIVRNLATPAFMTLVVFFFYAMTLFGAVSGRWYAFPLHRGLAAFTQPFHVQTSDLIAAVVGEGPLGQECLLVVGYVYWDGDRVNVQPLPRDGGGVRAGDLQSISRSSIRRIIYEHQAAGAPSRTPSDAMSLQPCRLGEFTQTMPSGGILSLPGPTLPPLDVRLNDQTVSFGRRTILLPFFPNSPDPGTMEHVFTASAAQSAMPRQLKIYMDTLASALDRCATPGAPVVMDVMGFASDKRLSSSPFFNNDELNWALAEGRRRYVLGLLDAANLNILVRPWGSIEAPRPLAALLEQDWAKADKRFSDFEDMRTQRSKLARAAAPGGNGIEELLARAVMIQFESLGTCDATP